MVVSQIPYVSFSFIPVGCLRYFSWVFLDVKRKTKNTLKPGNFQDLHWMLRLMMSCNKGCERLD